MVQALRDDVKDFCQKSTFSDGRKSAIFVRFFGGKTLFSGVQMMYFLQENVHKYCRFSHKNSIPNIWQAPVRYNRSCVAPGSFILRMNI